MKITFTVTTNTQIFDVEKEVISKEDIGQVVHRLDGWYYQGNSKSLSASELRQIADHLDELNSGSGVD
jgi:hypothetical protein